MSKTRDNETMSIKQLKYTSPDGGKNYNRLTFEKSPYLLQHADNPVNWHPWSEQAFKIAKDEEKPIFLSIGYSTCHWCHVMERESFEDEEVAQLLNRYYISIKVDREERPDIDNIYMTVCQSLTGSGGWPLTIIMSPDKKPFFAGTYLPKEAKFGKPGIIEILNKIASLWENKREELLNAGEQITNAIINISETVHSSSLSLENMKKAYEKFLMDFDNKNGGFGSSPKFPGSHNLSFLLRWWERTREEKALFMVEKTLNSMSNGGIFDHLGYGFHRYSTDAQWLIPHFEKMLYDQAMLAIAYIEAYKATGNILYADIVRKIFTYVSKDMTSPEGAFYSAEDADSEGEEGKFYVWTQKEIIDILGKNDGDIFCRFYGITRDGNFDKGRSILHINKTIQKFSEDEKICASELEIILERSREKLLKIRNKRIRPLKDDKILTDWNGLMIAAFAKGSQAFDEPEYAKASSRAANFILNRLRSKDGLLHRYRDGDSAVPGYVNDYAFLVWGLLELYEATFNTQYLHESINLTGIMLDKFWDEKNGGFYFTSDDSEKLIIRMKDVYDGAIPSGNSIATLNLLRLGKITMRQDLEKKAEMLLESFGEIISRAPTGFSQFLIALDFAIGPIKEIVIAGNLEDKNTKQMLTAVRMRFIPRKILILHPDAPDGNAIESIVPFLKQQNKINEKATAYICKNYVCESPTTELEKLISFLE